MKRDSKHESKQVPGMAMALVVLMAGCALGAVGYGLTRMEAIHYPQFLALLLVCVVASRLKVKLPGMNGSMSVNFPFLLLSVAALGLLEAAIMAVVAALVQSLLKTKQRPRLVQVVFNVSTMATALALAHLVFTSGSAERTPATIALMMAASAITFFLANTIPAAVVIGLTEGKNPAKVWHEVCLWSFPYYLAGAGVASMVLSIAQWVGWIAPLAVLPLMYLVYCSYKFFLGLPQMAAQGVEPAAAVMSIPPALLRGQNAQASLGDNS